MFTLILSCLLLQYPADPVRGAEQAQLLIQAHARALAAAAQQEKVLQRHSFEAKFNAFLKAAEAFARKYNEGRGDVWPQREAVALRKALAELQKESALRTNNVRGQDH
jgi:hypothetical protein